MRRSVVDEQAHERRRARAMSFGGSEEPVEFLGDEPNCR
jgi:hypothetical protein